jgi:3-hydroxyacyl-[acyl-carrier-protein] dehydratase
MASTLLDNFYTLEDSVQGEDSIQTTLRLNKDHEIFKGHFPNRPVTPGVIVMQLFKEELQRITGMSLQLQMASNVKFMSVVNPFEGDTFVLKSTFTENNDHIDLKGIGLKNDTIAIKINAVYQIT